MTTRISDQKISDSTPSTFAVRDGTHACRQKHSRSA